ncbi:chloramphenicol acetyltransferase-like domain-containing protein [Tanacetum coccineum]|uniref:Chloramphenicol acetyltransferase-like domain-containing protein n=1 Tax=Tanacetum coccineum TaxID=301880 RepID=A0ABQ5JDQ0_9ASTR
MEIKIRSIQIIKPLKPTLENQCSFKLSLFDQLAAFSNIDLILYYKPSCEVNIADRCTHLVKSLSEVLCSYYPLAGIVKEDGLEIDCCDQGVKYLETRVTTTLDNFIKKGPKIDNTRRLVGAPDQATTTLVTIQVNVFDCGALAIGVSALHKVTDTCNLIRFINEWAGINRTGGSTGAFCPSFDNLAFPPMEVPLSNYPPIPNTTRSTTMWLPKASSKEICTQTIACHVEVDEELMQNNFCLYTSWCSFPIYDVDFGWGKPYWASGIGSTIEMVTLMDGKDGDGIEAWVSLKEKDMKLFEQDLDILAFTS